MLIHLVCISYLFFLTNSVRCKPDYSFSFEAGGWLKLHTTPLIWEEAFVKCHDEGAVLASPLNKDLAKALYSQLAQFGVKAHIFLGTHDFYSKGDYVSVEGVPLNYMDISWGPRGSGVNTGDCLTMSVDGSADYSSCKDPLPFICYRKLDNKTMNECGTFDNGYYLNQRTGSCYKIHRDKQTWTRAYSLCASEGGYLVILNDDEEANMVKDMLSASTDNANQSQKFHVGLGAWGKDRIWTTIHGDRIEDVYNQWLPGQPDNLKGIQNRGSWNGKLDDLSIAGVKLMFACEKSPQSRQFEDLPPCSDNIIRLCNVCEGSQFIAE